jgi:DNA end-binding protein Ku
VPVKLYAASSSKAVKFNMICPETGSRIKQKLVNGKGDEVQRGQTLSGYEYTKGEWITLTGAEINSFKPENDKAIALADFIPVDKIDPIYYNKSYFLTPDKGGANPYHLLRQVMVDSGKAAFGRYRVRDKENLVLIRATREGLILHTLHYDDEVRSFSDLDIETSVPNEQEIELANQLVEQLASGSFKISEHEDEYRLGILDLIQRKLDGEEISTEDTVRETKPIIDMVAALRGSLEEK